MTKMTLIQTSTHPASSDGDIKLEWSAWRRQNKNAPPWMPNWRCKSAYVPFYVEEKVIIVFLNVKCLHQ